jgi:probable F420-dependent oxidoreductase
MEAADAVAELEGLGYPTVFVPGGEPDTFDRLELLLKSSSRLVVASGIINIWNLTSNEVAISAAKLRSTFENRFLLGLGVGHRPTVDADEPGRYKKPVAAMIRFLDALDAAVDPVPNDGRIVAALSDQMLEVARLRAAGSHPYLVTPEHTARARELLGEGSLLAPEQAVLLEADPSTAREKAREHVSYYFHFENYTNNWRRMGFIEDDFSNGGSDRLVDALVVWGGEERILQRIQEHQSAGADHVSLQVVGTRPTELPLESWRRLAPVVIGGA